MNKNITYRATSSGRPTSQTALVLRALLVAILGFFFTNGYADGIDVKGITLGEPEAALERIYPVPGCEDLPTKFTSLGDRYCSYPYSTYGSAEVKLTYYIFDGTIESALIGLKPDDFDQVVSAMKSRFGVPTTDRSERVVTRVGVPYTNRVVSWKRKDGIIEATRYAGSISESVISFSSKRYASESAKRNANKVKGRASDL